jgi:hypothetical protein
MGKVDETDQGQGSKKCEIYQIQGGDAEPQEQYEGKKAHEEFHERIAQGYRSTTFPASALENHKTHQGDVIIETDRGFTTGAMRGRCDDGFAVGNPMDADVKEAPDDGSKDKAEKKREPAHRTPLPFFFNSFR